MICPRFFKKLRGKIKIGLVSLSIQRYSLNGVFTITRIMRYICLYYNIESDMKFIQILEIFFYILQEKKSSPNIYCIIYFIISYEVFRFKEGISILFPLRFLADCLWDAKKSIQRCRNGTRNGDVDPFNSASVWLFILSIVTFFLVHAGDSQDFLTRTTFARTSSGACVLRKNAFVLALVSKLRSFIYLLDSLPQLRS